MAYILFVCRYNTMATQFVCPDNVVAGCLITKEKRQEMYGRVAGGAGSTKPEKYQRQQVQLGTGHPCPTTQTRIHRRRYSLCDVYDPMTREDGYDYTENFDGKQRIMDRDVYINFKCVVGQGGAQTRTLRDQTYAFIEAQLAYCLKTKTHRCYFANILDGDEAAASMKHFHYLLALPEFADVRKYIYVGDLKGYFGWLTTQVCQSGGAQ
jgi:hypothetical protein